MAGDVYDVMVIERQTHVQPGGEVCETAQLSDGRVLRVIGHETYKSVTAELRGWLALLGLAMVLWGCGGAAFEPGPDAIELPDAQSAPADGGSRGGDSSSADGGETEATQDAGCDRCSCLPDGAVGCAIPPFDASDECLLFTHSDGIGQSWMDCTPPGTYDLAEAQAACMADSSPCFQHSCTGGDQAVCNRDLAVTGYCTCWTYAGPDAGHVNSEPCVDVAHAYCGGSVTWN